jgi:hypothetical protein
MPQSALDPYFATNSEPISAARKGAAVTPNDNADLAQVTSSLIVTIGSGGTGVAVIFANGSDQQAVTIPLTPGTYQLNMQARRVMATNTNVGTGGGVTALWG